MKLRSPLGIARGLGSAKSGVQHWWLQRVTAIALIPLALWFVVAVIRVAGMDYAGASAWVAAPLNATLLVALLVALFWHAQLGLQVVLEDYIHAHGPRIFAQISIRLGLPLAALAAVLAVLRIASGNQ